MKRDGLARSDGLLELGQGGGGAALLACRQHAHRRRRAAARQQLGPAVGEAEQGKSQRFTVGEAVLEHEQAGRQGRELVGCELDGRQVPGRRRQRVELAVGRLAGFAGDADAQRGELRPVFIEAPLEGLVGHQGIALDAPADLVGGRGLARP